MAEPAGADGDTFRVSGPARALLGLLLLAATATLLATLARLELAIGAAGAVLVLVVLVPALALLRRRVLRARPGAVVVEDGWLFRRGRVLQLDGAELEIVPTAGLRAVVLHRAGRGEALATWLGRGRAERLAVWLDRVAGRPLPRRATPGHRLDV